MTTNYSPEIYIACLASYNNGILYGKWIDADQSSEDLEVEIQEILAKSPTANAEEWAIHDYSDFDDIKLSEYEDLETISEVAQNIVEHGELFIELYKDTYDIANSLDMIENRFIGTYDSVVEYLEETTDLSEVPQHLQYYIDFEHMARDLELGGEITTFRINSETAIFF
jgi:antirestriction protein